MSRKMFGPLLVGLVLLSSTLFTGCTPIERLPNVKSWAFALGIDLEDPGVRTTLSNYDLVVVDGEDATDELVAGLKEDGALVLGYVSVGSIENWRSWYSQVSAYRLELMGDWPGEWYANTAQAGYRNVITNSVAPMILAKGFDGLFLDNVDMIENHAPQMTGMYTLVEDLAALVHTDDRLLFTQNGADVTEPVMDDLDGWNREDVTSTYDWDTESYVLQSTADRTAAADELESYDAGGVFTTATDYTSGSDPDADALARTTACDAGAVPFISDIELTRVPITPVTCP